MYEIPTQNLLKQIYIYRCFCVLLAFITYFHALSQRLFVIFVKNVIDFKFSVWYTMVNPLISKI